MVADGHRLRICLSYRLKPVSGVGSPEAGPRAVVAGSGPGLPTCRVRKGGG